MLELLFGWIQNLSVYLIASAALLYAVPGEEYRKYIRFYSGLVLMLLLLTPVLKIAGVEHTFREIRQGLEAEMRTMEETLSMQEKQLDFLSSDPADEPESAEEDTDASGAPTGQGRTMIVEEIKIGE